MTTLRLSAVEVTDARKDRGCCRRFDSSGGLTVAPVGRLEESRHVAHDRTAYRAGGPLAHGCFGSGSGVASHVVTRTKAFVTRPSGPVEVVDSDPK